MKKFINALLGGLLGLLGFGSCDSPILGGLVAMYGQPHADFTVKGTVTDETGTPIEGIKTVVDSYYEWVDDAGYSYSQLDFSDTLYTDAQGRIEMGAGLFDKGRVVVTLTDVDGEENGGTFEEKVLDNVPLEQVEKGDGAWYNGAYEAVFEARLKRKD